ncbi:hypothetical protein ACJ41O_014529 [Fusarium nematophilum]
MTTPAPNIASSADESTSQLSLVYGPAQPELLIRTLGSLVEEQADKFGSRCAVSAPWQAARLSYRDLADRSKLMAKAMLEMGMRHGDCVGIMAGNCSQYIEVFLGGARIGCPVVVINNTFAPDELQAAVARVNCKLVFVASNIGTRSLQGHVEKLLHMATSESHLTRLVTIGHVPVQSYNGVEVQSYSAFLGNSHSIFMNDTALKRAERQVEPSDVLNLQFTSGRTHALCEETVADIFTRHNRCTKSSLSHSYVNSPSLSTRNIADRRPDRNLINNARFNGHAMRLTQDDIVCCPPPLFHCFGLVMGFLASFCHGSTIVFPSDNFNAEKTIEAVVSEKATALLGVPTMFIAELDALEKNPQQITTLRTGLAAGSPVPKVLMESLRQRMNIQGMLIAYGMTETSPVTFITSLDDTEEKMHNSIGQVFPHTAAKVIDGSGNVVPVGTRGELCTSGFALQKGYWNDEEKTQEVMRRDGDGVVWMHTGDEGFIDQDGYGHITGRIKDIIIRGGENITPTEIENRLLAHPCIAESCVVGLADYKYGEVVSAFLKAPGDIPRRPSDDEVRHWVSQHLGRVKSPQHIFWLGDKGVGDELPKTGSGKYQKHLIREIGNAILKRARITSKFDFVNPLQICRFPVVFPAYGFCPCRSHVFYSLARVQSEEQAATAAAFWGHPAHSTGLYQLSPDLFRRLSTIEAQLARLSEQGAQEANVVAQSNTSQLPQQPDEAVSPSQVRPPTTQDYTDAQPRVSNTMPSPPNMTESDTTPFSTMPPDPVVQHLVDMYFLHAHNQPYAYFQEEHFRQLLSFMLLPKCLIFAVLASSVRFSSHEFFQGRTHEAMEGYARQAWLCVLTEHLTVENIPNLHVAQTTNLLAIVDFTAGRTSSGWLKIGLAVRIAQDLQLMKEPSPMLPIVEQEERRRVFWSVYLLDKLVSCGKARPPALADEDCHVQLPCEEEVFRTGTWKQTATLHQLLNWNTDLGEIRGHFTLAILVASALGRCARYVLHERETDDVLPWDSRSEYAAINSFLLLIEQHLQVEELPINDIIDKNRLPDGSLDHQIVGHAIFARVVFHLCHCLLNHPFLLALRLQKLKSKAPPSFLSRAFDTCRDHASKLPAWLDQAQNAGCHVEASFYAYSTCLAGSVLSLFIHAGQSRGQIVPAELLESGQQCLQTLKDMSAFWDHAAKMHAQLLAFDAHAQAFEKMIDPHASFDIEPELEAHLWSIVDYGSMCGSSREASGGPMPMNMPSPSFLNFDVDYTAGNFELSGAEPLGGARASVSSYGVNC